MSWFEYIVLLVLLVAISKLIQGKEEFKNLFCLEGKFTKNKAYSFEILYYRPMLIELSVNLSWSGHDHAGPKVEFGLLGLSVSMRIYDTRHWDYENDQWENYEQPSKATKKI